MSTPPTVLFICQHNAGRSQLGAHLLEHIAQGRANATSGGLSPAEHINPVIAEALGVLTKGSRLGAPRGLGCLIAAVLLILRRHGDPPLRERVPREEVSRASL